MFTVRFSYVTLQYACAPHPASIHALCYRALLTVLAGLLTVSSRWPPYCITGAVRRRQCYICRCHANSLGWMKTCKYVKSLRFLSVWILLVYKNNIHPAFGFRQFLCNITQLPHYIYFIQVYKIIYRCWHGILLRHARAIP